MSKEYTKEQIKEAISYWKGVLNESGEAQARPNIGGITDVSMEAALESLSVYDKVIGVQYGLKNDYNIKFTEDFIDLVNSLIMTDKYREIRKYYLGVKFISDYEMEEYDDRLTREEKIEDARYALQEDWNTRYDMNDLFKPTSTLVADGIRLFKPTSTLVADGIRYDGQTGVGICVLYAFW